MQCADTYGSCHRLSSIWTVQNFSSASHNRQMLPAIFERCALSALPLCWLP